MSVFRRLMTLVVVTLAISIVVLLLTGCGSSTRVDDAGCPWTLDRLYLETEACVGLTAPAPVVIFKPFPGSFGLYTGGEVWINTSPHWDLFRTCELEEQTLRREYVHHLLWVNLGDLSHDSPFFVQCV